MRDWHIVTCEYPPDIGGVGDHSFQIATGFSLQGLQPQVWTAGNEADSKVEGPIRIHRCFSRFTPIDLLRANKQWKSAGPNKRILLQWTPSGYGLKSANLPFCFWILCQVVKGDELFVFFHEGFFSLSEKLLRRRAAAVVQRLMTIILLNSAKRIFVSTSSLIQFLSPLAFRRIEIQALPIPSSIPFYDDPAASEAVRQKLIARGSRIVGHFGLYSPVVEPILVSSLLELLRLASDVQILLVGGGSHSYREKLIASAPEMEGRVFATGECSPQQASVNISACDLMFQPYSEGITTRRTSTMAALSHSKCLVSTMGPRSEEIWKTAPAIALLETRNPAVIANLLAGLLQDPAELKSRGAAGCQFYQENFAVSHMVEALSLSATND